MNIKYEYFKDNTDLKAINENEAVSVLVSFTTTPFGEFLYPKLVVLNEKALRPISIDGILYIDEKIYVKCLLTETNSVTLIFDIKKESLSTLAKNKSVWFNAIMRYADNPFHTNQTIEFKNGKIALYHHTKKEFHKKILKSGFFYNSKWNFQGTRKFKDYGFVYFTDIPVIKDDYDLAKIGMRGPSIQRGIVSDIEETELIDVYSDDARNRNRAIKVWINPEILHLNSIILHKNKTSSCETPTYYSWIEVFCRNIYRLVLEGDSTLSFKKLNKNEVIIEDENKIQDYGFLAGLGTSLEDLRLLWCENLLQMRNLSIEEKEEWVDLWKNSYYAVSLNQSLEYIKKASDDF